MGIIPRALEDALVAYLVSCCTASEGGLWRFRPNAGAGVALEIRPGHYAGPVLPSEGRIVCECVDGTVQQEIVGVNSYGAVAKIHLELPADTVPGEANAVAAADYIATEISDALVHPLALETTNRLASGIVILGPKEGVSMQAGIDGGMRVWQWFLNLRVSAVAQRTIEA